MHSASISTALVCLLLTLALAACNLDTGEDAAETLSEPTTQPFDTSTQPTSGGGIGIGSPPSVTCNPDRDDFRCLGDTVQVCDPFTDRWQNDQICSAIGERCSELPADCSGFVNFACCVR